MIEREEQAPIQARERYGVSSELFAAAKTWATEWAGLLEDFNPTELDNETLLTARDVAQENLGASLDRDINGAPSFRTQYVATQELFGIVGDRGDEYRRLLEGDSFRTIPNFERLDEVLDVLLEARKARAFPYYLDAAQLPQDERNMPPSLPRGGKDHANFLFTSCYYMRGGIKSYAAFRALSLLYEGNPDLFEPEQAKDMDPEAIADLLQSVGLAFSKNVISNQWVKNARRLVDEYDGDTRNLFENTTDYQELLRRIQNKKDRGFAGFQEKMTSMLTYYLMSSELIPYFDFPLPVDFHVLRVSAATGIISFQNLPADGNIYRPETLAMLRAMYHDYSVTHGVSQLDVCDAVWSLSSAICGNQPGNIMLEPNRKAGRNGRSTEIYPLPIDINDVRQQNMYNSTCALCPLEDRCEQNYPSKTYYVQGKMVGSPRIRLPRTTLF